MPRRLLRILFNALAALSLLLCVGVCVLWVRSYWRTTGLYRETGGGEVVRTDWYPLQGGRFHSTRREGRIRGGGAQTYARYFWRDKPLSQTSQVRVWDYGLRRGEFDVKALVFWYYFDIDAPEPDPLWRRSVWAACSAVVRACDLPPALWLDRRDRGGRAPPRPAADLCPAYG